MALKVYVTRRVPQAGLNLLAQHASVEVGAEDALPTQDELCELVHGCDGVLCHLTDSINDAVMTAAGKQCRVFANYAVGYNNLDIAAANRHGVWLTNTPGVLTETTADLAWSLLMSVARRIVESDRYFRTGQWQGWGPMQFLGQDIHGATLGIVGAGRIGSAVARRGTGFGMRILYVARHDKPEMDQLGGERVDLETLLRESDFVSLHVPLTDETKHMVGADELAMMKPTACLINTARGPVVDEAALVQVLRDKRIAGAAMDVYEKEPIPAPGLTDLDNVVCVPHLGSATGATREKMAIMAAENIVAALKGECPPNCLNTEARV